MLNFDHIKKMKLSKNISQLSAQDMGGRQICQIFLMKPDPDVYADYYKVISEPMDLRIIDDKITNNLYPNIEAMMRDVVLMFKNARQYNEPNSRGM